MTQPSSLNLLGNTTMTQTISIDSIFIGMIPAVTRPTIAVLQSILYGVFFLLFAYFLNTLNYIIIMFSIKSQKKYHKKKG